jgi:hypothetical protein
VIYRFLGMWVLRRAFRILTASEAGPLSARLTREARRILLGAAITLALLVGGVIVAIVLLVGLLT